MKKIIKRILFAILIVILLVFVYGLFSGEIERQYNPLKYEDIIYENSMKNDLDPYLVMGVIRTESSFRENVKSHADAKGLMQITNDTAEFCASKMELENFTIDMIYDPEINIQIGTWYLRWLLNQFDNNEKEALAAYNGGIGNVRKWLADEKYSPNGTNLDTIPFEETENFVTRVKRYQATYERLY